MAYVVELPISDEDFTERMNAMRAWLDHRRVQPRGFRVTGTQQSGCRVHFVSAAEAEAFAREFGGRLLDTPATEKAII